MGKSRGLGGTREGGVIFGRGKDLEAAGDARAACGEHEGEQLGCTVP